MPSNHKAPRQLKDFGSGVGFNTREVDKEYSHGVLMKALNKAFSPGIPQPVSTT